MDDYLSTPSFFDLFLKYIDTNQREDQEYILIVLLTLSHLSAYEEFVDILMEKKPNLISMIASYMTVNINNHHIIENLFIVLDNILHLPSISTLYLFMGIEYLNDSSIIKALLPLISKVPTLKLTPENVLPLLWFSIFMYKNNLSRITFLSTWTSLSSLLSETATRSANKLPSSFAPLLQEFNQHIQCITGLDTCSIL